ncbi:MAG: CRTAC1 family protein, partial [Myxococcota bacterium]|nr:CRTAC1 family protein [Myxococcota bacterium]
VYTGYNADDSNAETSEIMLNAGDGTFLLGPDDSDVRKSNSDQPAGASFVDYNRDGLLDLWTGQASGTQDRLLWGYGDGSFVDVTLGVELRTSGWSDVQTINEGRGHSISWSATACDLNNDGWPDLLASSYGRAPNHLWRSQEGTTFVNQSVASGYAYDDNQDWSDDESARCWCTLHPDAEDCEGVPAPEFIVCNSDSDAFRWDHETSRNAYRLGGNSGATVCADLNNDGWNDLITTEIVHWDVGASSDPSEILYNTQSDDIVFDRPGNDRTGLTRKHDGITWDDGDMSATAFDFDNDMRKDIYIGSSDYPGTRGLLYHQTEEGVFEEVALSAGIEHHRSHGVAVADFDNDGDLDMIVGHSSSRCDDDCPESFHARLYENQRDGMSNFVQVHLVGTGKSNSAAIGARVEVTANGVTQMQEVGGGYGHYGAQNPLILHFGLGDACRADVTVFWPNSSRTQESYSLEAGHRYRIEQGSEESILFSLSQRE